MDLFLFGEWVEKVLFHGSLLGELRSLPSCFTYCIVFKYAVLQQTIHLFFASLVMSHLRGLPFESSGFGFKVEIQTSIEIFKSQEWDKSVIDISVYML